MRIFETQEEALEFCALIVIAGWRETIRQHPDNEYYALLENNLSPNCPKVHEVFKEDKPSKTIKVKVWYPLVLAKARELLGKP